MLVNFTRTIILYVLVIISMRVMGKKQVGDLDPIEFVVVLLLSELASIPMQDMDLPLIHSIVPIATLVALELALSALSLKSRTFRKLLDGSPSVIVKHGKMDLAEMKKLRYSVEEVLELLRTAGYADIRDVEFAILENSGNVSVIPSPSGKVATVKDLKIDVKPGALPYPVIIDGKIIKENLAGAKIDEIKLNKLLLSSGVSSVDEILYAAYDTTGEFYFQRKERTI